MKVYAWPADSAGCRYYRLDLPMQALADRGHDVLVDPVMPDEWRDTADVIIGQRVCLPGATVRWQQLAKQGRAKLVLEIDDDLFNIHPSSKRAHAFFAQPGVRANLEMNLRAADLVTVTTDHLAEQLSPYNPNIAVLPNCIPAALLDHTPARREDILTIGWGGSATHQIDWTGPDEHIARYVTRNPGTEMHVMGWTPPVLWGRLPRDRRRVTGWIHGRVTGWIHHVNDLHRAIDYHVGVIPLRDMPFNLSKSDIKFVEMAALGIPVVASGAGPYALSVQHETTGYLVTRPQDWQRYVAQLVADGSLRETVGKAAQEWARTRTVEGNAHLWEAAYQGV